MSLLQTEIQEATRNKFEAELTRKVQIILFSQEPSRLVLPDRLLGQDCLYCRETKQLLEEVSALSDKITLTVYDFKADQERATAYRVEKIPAIVILPEGGQDAGIRFFGIPSGYEYTSLLETLVDVSRGGTGLSPATKTALAGLAKDVQIQVFVTPTCPYCTAAVRLAHQFALESPRIRGEMIEATEFPHLAQKYNVFGVPKTVMNEAVELEGAVPESTFLESVLKAGR
jgi:glutaredoxin-like protein